MQSLKLERHFSSATLARARIIVRNDQALIEEDDVEEEGVLSGVVKGTAKRPYSVQIFLDEDDVDVHCSCPVGIDCKHGAALLMVWMDLKKNPPELKKDDYGNPLSARRRQLSKALGDDHHVLGWVDGLVRALDSDPLTVETLTNDADSDAQFLYELKGVRVNAGPTLGVRVIQTRRLKNGQLGKGRLYDLDDYYGYYEGDVSDADEIIFDLLRTCMERYGYIAHHQSNGAIALQGNLGAYLLQQLIDSGKAYWNDEREVPLTQGPEIDAQISWQSNDEKSGAKQKLKLTSSLHENGQLYLANTTPIWYLDPENAQLGIVRSRFSAALLNSVNLAPELPASAAQALSNLIAPQAQKVSLPLPAEPSIKFIHTPMVCRLRLYSADGSAHVRQWTLQVLMCYGEQSFHVELQPTSRVTLVTLDDGTQVEVARDHAREYRQYQFFRRRVSGFEPVYARDPERFTIADHQPLLRSDEERFRAFERLFDAFETLEAEGFDIVVEEPVSLEAETVTDFDFDVQPVDNNWFELGLQLKHKGQHYNLLPLILDWLGRGDRDKPLSVVAVDGRRLSVPSAMIRPVAETLLELYDDSKEQLSLTRARAASLTRLSDELKDAGAQSEWNGDKTLLALAEKVRRITVNQQALLKSAKAPRTLKAELREYQLTGMAWLNFLHEAGFCGVLADDMGLGKTVQTLAHVLSLKQRRKLDGPCLVIAPTSVLGNWAREAERFAPSLNVRVWHGMDRHDDPLADSKALLVVTSYALALRDHEILATHGFKVLILDEAQVIKNPSAKITQSLKRMPVQHRICLTGTPLENHLGELWSLFDFLMPGLLGPQKRFSQHFRTPIEKHGDADRQKRLNNAIAPFLLRRRKQQVAAELPPKTEIIEKIELESDQARLYETIRIGMEKRVRKLLQEQGVAKSHIQMLDALLKLRQSCCHPDLVKLDSARRVKGSAKTEHVLGMLDELVAEGRKIILFSQFTQMLDIIEREVARRGIRYVKLTGRTRKRDEVIDAFQAGDVPLFLISLKAGGTGLNLTAADTVIHYDPWWNPAVENQATDRAHRIGQDKPVFVYKLIANNTVEDKIVAMQARKKALAEATVERGDANPVKSLSAEDILSLFAED